MQEVVGAPNWRRAWWRLAPLTILVVVLAKVVSILLSGFGLEDRWYDSLRQPFPLPMAWVYPLAWPVVCALLGCVWAMVLSVPPTPKRYWGLVAFYAGLAINFLWLPIFRVAHDMALTKVLLAALICLLTASIVIFFSIRRVAGLLLIPYLFWIIFVTAWVIGVERLNPAAGESIMLLTEDKIDAVRKEDRRRLREGGEWDRWDDGGSGSRSERNDSREDPRMDRRERRD